MYELSRVRLHSIGPRGARFSDVLLDFSDVGAPVTGPHQDALFGEGRTRPRRPSPASVLFLENGGGKSVLMKLIFSVVLPGRRQVVGTSNGRVLDNFVLARDCGHVICEWQHAVTGERIVTGKVSEWKGRASTGDVTRLADAWYGFRPGGAVELDTLPLTRDGRLVTLSGFRQRLLDAAATETNLDLVWETSPGAWNEHLGVLGLDPELFRYQRAMNAGEGEAAEAFAFGSDEQFVDFLLRAVTPLEDPVGLQDVVDGYAGKLAERAVLAAERDFVAGVLDRLHPLVDAVTRRAQTETALTVAASQVAGLAATVDARLARDTAGVTQLDAEAAVAADAERAAEIARGRAGDRVLALRTTIAQLRLAVAERDRDTLVAAREAGQRTLDAWRATEEVLRLAAASAEAERLTRLVADAETKAAPALAERDAAGRALVRGLLTLATASDAQAAAADVRAGEHEAQADRAARAERHAADEAATARAHRQSLAEHDVSATDALRRAVADGLVPDVSCDVAALARDAAEAAAAAAGTVRAGLDAVQACHRARQDAADREREAERACDTARAVLARLGDERDRARAASDALAVAAGDRLAEVLGDVPAVDLDADAERALAALGTAIDAAETRKLALSMAADADARVLDALGAGNLLPARPEVTAAIDVLEAAGVTAVAGWLYLAGSVGEEQRDAVLLAHPELVDGVVLPVAGSLERARAALSAARLLPRGIVAVGTAAVLIDLGGADPDSGSDGRQVFLIPPNPAMFDEDAAETERAAIRARHGERSALMVQLTARINRDRSLAAAITAWRAQNPSGRLTALATDAGHASDALAAADRVLAEARVRAAASAAEADAALAALRSQRADEQSSVARATTLDRLARTVGDRSRTAREAAAFETAAQEKAGEASRHHDTAEEARRSARDAHRRADAARRNADAARTETAGVMGAGDPTHEPAHGTSRNPAPDAPDERGRANDADLPVAVLRTVYEAANRTYAQVEVETDLRAGLERCRRTQAAARAANDVLPAGIRAQARELLAGVSGGDAVARAAGEAEARRGLVALGRDLDDVLERLGGLREELRQVGAESRHRAVGPPAGPWAPRDLPHAEDLLRTARAEVARAAEAHERVRAHRESLVEAARRADSDLSTLRAVADLLADALAETGGPASGGPVEGNDADPAEPFTGSADAARIAATQVRAVWRAAAGGVAATHADVRTAADTLALWAGQDRFDTVKAPARRQLTRAGRET
uniref:hypothetical protein n=1 Tax=Frankia sp. Cppng1_Ct_nod TaxID=2897162 RepID=UPI0020255AC6